jgi:hypothetical protein
MAFSSTVLFLIDEEVYKSPTDAKPPASPDKSAVALPAERDRFSVRHREIMRMPPADRFSTPRWGLAVAASTVLVTTYAADAATARLSTPAALRSKTATIAI